MSTVLNAPIVAKAHIQTAAFSITDEILGPFGPKKIGIATK